MEEDRHFSPEKNGYALDTDFSVEVEMEAYSNETAEYEMSDDGFQSFEHASDHELLDVEVPDASHSTDVHQDVAFVTVEEDMSLVDSPLPQLETHEEVPAPEIVEVVEAVASHTEELVLEDEVPQEDVQVIQPAEPAEEASEQDLHSYAADASETDLPAVEVAANDSVNEAPSADDSDTAQQREELDVATKDPHEISEGVYIDPPPAVLLSVPSLDQLDIHLFNPPRSARSGTTTPSARGSESPEPDAIVLLQQLPTLYYEPLSKVFDALRHEEYISRIPNLTDSELVLDAYDLQLVVPEDNVYAREVSLHDLNLLHDGSDISGPLRLRLRATTPRFILRYHLIQDQISRLNLELAEQHEDPATISEPVEQNEEQDYEQRHEPSEGATNENNVPDQNEYPELPPEDEEVYTDTKAGEDEPEATNTEDTDTENGKVHDSTGQEPADGQSEYADGEPDDESRPDSTPRVVGSPLPPDDTTGNDQDFPEPEENLDDPQEIDAQGTTSADASTIEASTDAQALEPTVPNEPEEVWDDDLDAEGDPDLTWDVEEEQETASNESIATLSSKTSKRSFHDLESDGEEHDVASQASSPGSKRARLE